jgi:hypothetical protein
MGDAVCSRRERKRPTNATDEEREEEKKVPQKSGNLENEPTQVLLFAFFSSSFFCFLVLSSPSEVLLFLKKARVFLLLFCAYQTQDIKTPRRFVAIP